MHNKLLAANVVVVTSAKEVLSMFAFLSWSSLGQIICNGTSHMTGKIV